MSRCCLAYPRLSISRGFFISGKRSFTALCKTITRQHITILYLHILQLWCGHAFCNTGFLCTFRPQASYSIADGIFNLHTRHAAETPVSMVNSIRQEAPKCRKILRIFPCERFSAWRGIPQCGRFLTYFKIQIKPVSTKLWNRRPPEITNRQSRQYPPFCPRLRSQVFWSSWD